MARLPNPGIGDMPNTGAQTRPVPRQAGTGAMMSGAPPSGAVGAVTSRLGQQLFELAMQEQEKMDTLRAEDAFTQLRERQLDLTYNERDGYVTRRGSAAANADLVGEYGKRFDAEFDQIAKTLSNPVQVEKFRQRADVSQLQFREGVLRHKMAETDAYRKDTYLAAVAVEGKFVTANYDKPEQVALSITRVEDQVKAMGEALKWSPDRIEQERLARVGPMHAAVVQQAMAAREWDYAASWFDTYRDEMDLATAKQFESGLRDATQQSVFDQYMGEFLTNRDSQKGLQALITRVGSDPELDDVKKNILIGRAEARHDALENRGRIARDTQEREVERAIKQLDGITLAGFEVTPEMIAPVMQAAKGNPYLEQLVARTIATAEATRKFRMAPPAVQERMLTEYEAAARKDPSKFDVTALQRLREIFTAQQQLLKTDPVSFTVRQGLIEPDTPPATPLNTQEPAKVETMPQRMVLARAAQANYGAPLKPLTNEEKDLAIQTIATLDVDGKRKWLSDMLVAARGDHEAYRAVLGQVAEGNNLFAHAGVAATRQNDGGAGQRAAAYLLRGDQILNGKKPDGSRNVTLPMPPAKDMRGAFDDYVREAFAGNPGAREGHYDAAVAIYAAMSADAGDRDTSVFDADRFEEAMTLAIGGVADYKGRRTVTPWMMDETTFRDQMRLRIKALHAAGKFPEHLHASTVLSLPVAARRDGVYMLLDGDQPIMERPQKGKPSRAILIDFNTRYAEATLKQMAGENTPPQDPALELGAFGPQ